MVMVGLQWRDEDTLRTELRALLESADALKGLSYDIQWTEFPAAAPLAEALNAGAVDSGPIGDAPADKVARTKSDD